MAKSYTSKMAEAIKARLNEGHPFTIDGDAKYWAGYIIVTHPLAGEVVIQPWAPDMRKNPTTEAVDTAMDIIRWRLTPQPYTTPEWQDKYLAAHRDWMSACTVEEEEEEN